MSKHRRRDKRKLRKLSEELARKGYFEDCFYMPAKVTDLSAFGPQRPHVYKGRWIDSDVRGESLITGRGGAGCSLTGCNPLPLTEAEAMERAQFHKEHGNLEYMFRYAYLNDDGTPLNEEQRQETIRELETYWITLDG